MKAKKGQANELDRQSKDGVLASGVMEARPPLPKSSEQIDKFSCSHGEPMKNRRLIQMVKLEPIPFESRGKESVQVSRDTWEAVLRLSALQNFEPSIPWALDRTDSVRLADAIKTGLQVSAKANEYPWTYLQKEEHYAELQQILGLAEKGIGIEVLPAEPR